MRLRDNIHPTQRFNSELFYTPAYRGSRRTARSRELPPYIDYNPNLPPAAFPTLDILRTPDKSNHGKIKQSAIKGELQRNGNLNGNHGSNMQDEERGVEFDDLPIDSIENDIASNGDLNPVYARNMAIMATARQSSSDIDLDMEDSDPDDVMADGDNNSTESDSSIHDLEWRDLSPGMQVEIIDNLFQYHSWSGVSRMLGLTAQELEKIKEHLNGRNKQIDRENSELKGMRAKQLRAVLRVDYSDVKWNRKPHQLMYRKTSRQVTRRLRESIELDYLICDAREVINARRFLHKCGVDRRFAGVWSNSILILRASGDDLEPERVEGLEGLMSPEPYASMEGTPTATDGHIFGLIIDCRPGSSTLVQRSNKNTIETPHIIRPRDILLLHPRGADVPARIMNNIHDQPDVRRKGLVRLRVGRERAAIIQNWERYIEPRKLVRRSPDPFSRTPSSLGGFDGSITTVTGPITPQSRPILDNSSHSLRGVMHERGSYDSSEPSQPPLAMSSRRRFEAQKETLEDNRSTASTASTSTSTFSEPRFSPIPSIPSQLTTPGRVLFSRSSDDFYTRDCFHSNSTIAYESPPSDFINDNSNRGAELS